MRLRRPDARPRAPRARACSRPRRKAPTSAWSIRRSTRSAIAETEPGREVVFFAIGFETTTPPTALAIRAAEKKWLTNFSILCNHVLTPPAMQGDSRRGDRRRRRAGPDRRLRGAGPCQHRDRHAALRVLRRRLREARRDRRLRAARRRRRRSSCWSGRSTRSGPRSRTSTFAPSRRRAIVKAQREVAAIFETARQCSSGGGSAGCRRARCASGRPSSDSMRSAASA